MIRSWWYRVRDDPTKRRAILAIGVLMAIFVVVSSLSFLVVPVGGPLAVIEVFVLSVLLGGFGWAAFSLLAVGLIDLLRRGGTPDRP